MKDLGGVRALRSSPPLTAQGRFEATHAAMPQAIGRAAAAALFEELALAPKPGLVSFVDTGSHLDMDARTFMRSITALRPAFVRFAALGARRAPFAELEQAGIEAEGRMLVATGGINTHRGAIFMLGLLCAVAGRLLADAQRIKPHALRQCLLGVYGQALRERPPGPARSHGARAARAHGLRSANAEAAAGFPVLFETALPALDAALHRGATSSHARSQAFFAALAALDDTNLVHRGGIEGLRFARHAARVHIAAGAAEAPAWETRAWSLHREFVARRLSPGGSADVLSAVCWLHRVRGADR